MPEKRTRPEEVKDVSCMFDNNVGLDCRWNRINRRHRRRRYEKTSRYEQEK